MKSQYFRNMATKKPNQQCEKSLQETESKKKPHIMDDLMMRHLVFNK